MCVWLTYYASNAAESGSEHKYRTCLSNFRKAKLPRTCWAT